MRQDKVLRNSLSTFDMKAHPDHIGYLTVDPKFVEHIGTSCNKENMSMRDFIETRFGKSVLSMTILQGMAIFIASNTGRPTISTSNPDETHITTFCDENGIVAEVEEVFLHGIYVGIKVRPVAVKNKLQYYIERLKAI